MATTTMRLGLLLMTALAIIHISKAEPEKEDESQIEQKSEGNMMASSMEEVELRSVREADNQKKKNQKKKGKTTNAKKSRRQKKKKNTKRQRKNKPRKSGRRKTGGRKGRKNSPNIPRRKKNKNGASKKMRFRKKKDKKLKKKKDKKLKKKKRTKKVRKNGRKNDGGMSVRQICDETALCQKIKDYIKYSNQLRKVKRIVKSCDTMEKKANKSVTEFDATVAALDEVIASNAKRRLYIRWRRTQRSTDEVVAIRDNLKNCSVSVKAKCEKKVQPACLEIVLLTECEALLQAWLNEFGPKTGSCLQASADCCACITGLGSVDAKCLDFDTKSTAAVKSKKTCTGSGTGAFGFCRKQQQEAAVKGPPAAQEACSGGTATKAPAAATTAAAGATTAAAAATTAAAQATTAAAATTAAGAATTAAAAATTVAAADDAITTRVKGYIDAGTCGSVTNTANCETSATSYYKSFTYNGKHVIISSQVPDHPAENDMLEANPNKRCEWWQYIQLPIDPTKGSSSSATSLGTVGLAVTGGAFFNDLSSPQGALAFANEVISLDSCFGHSAREGAYHYHANLNCTDAGAATGAVDPTKCVLIGYYNDGVPVYGLCKDSNEKQFTSCFKINDGATTTTVSHVSGSYAGIGATESDYSYDTAAFTAGTCNLDLANGAVHPTTGKYSYFATTGYPWLPKNFYGNGGTSTLCSAA